MLSANILMATAAVIWLSYEFYRLLWQPDVIGSCQIHPGAIDLKIFHQQVHQWASGKPISGGVYPPASNIILWPLLGWADIRFATWLWAATSVASLTWIVHIVIKESRAETTAERLFISLIPLSIYATGATIGNGQLGLHVLPMIIAGIRLMNIKPPRWGRDLFASALILASLVKPHFSAPFFWIVLFVTGRLRPALWVLGGYALLTVFAVWLHMIWSGQAISDFFMNSLVREFVQPLKIAAAVSAKAGESNLAIWADNIGLGKWTVYISSALLLLLGAWVFFHRNVDLWLILGVTAIVARFWTYHRWYDDLLILLPMIALFRLTKILSVAYEKTIAGLLLAVTLCLMIAPGGLYLLPYPWNMIWVRIQTGVWTIGLFFFLFLAWQEKRGSVFVSSSTTGQHASGAS